MSQLEQNTAALQALLEAVNALPEAGTPPEFAVLTNLAPDSSFETGGVWGAPLVQDSTHVKYGAYAGKITGVANKAETSSTSATTVSLTAGHKYYARFEWYMESARTVEKFGFYWPIVANSAFFNSTIEESQTGAWNSVSATHATPAESGDYPIRLDFDNAGATTTAWLDGIVLLDLTEGFGAGKEPSKEWCDQNIPYFSDTLISVIPELPELTNPAAASDIYTGKEAIDASGAKLTGTNPYNAANVDPAVTSALSAIAEKGVDTTDADLFDLASLIGSIEAGGGGGDISPFKEMFTGTITPSSNMQDWYYPEEMEGEPVLFAIWPAENRVESDRYGHGVSSCFVRTTYSNGTDRSIYATGMHVNAGGNEVIYYPLITENYVRLASTASMGLQAGRTYNWAVLTLEERVIQFYDSMAGGSG